MKTFKFLLLTLLLLHLLFSCGGDSDGGSSDAPQLEQDIPTNVKVIFDSDLTIQERNALANSTNIMGELNIDGSAVKKFSKIFGGNQSSNVVRYFEQRINYFLSATTALTDRLVTQASSSSIFNITEVLASNPSTGLWYLAKINEPEKIKVEINDKIIDIRSSRIGIMQVGAIFGGLDPVQQVITLVHEARHSDCTGGALASDLNRIVAGQLPLNKACGHAHEICPPGHPLEGEFACDSHPWGAYIVDAIYSISVSQTCSSCSQTQKQIAEAMALDALSRPLYDIQELLDGKLGEPNMTSSTKIR